MKQKYNSIIGLSGGLDSSMTAWTICNKGINPLALVVDNNWNTDIANRNIRRIINHFKLDCLWVKVDWEQFRDLQVAFLKSGISNVEIPTDHILYALVYKVADMVGAKIVYNGGNTATEGPMPEEYEHDTTDLKFIKAIHKQFGTLPMDKIPTLSIWGYLYYRFIKRIKIVQPLNKIDYRVKESKELLGREIGWEDYGLKHEESIFTKWFQNYYLPLKFGIDKRKPHFQFLVNSKQMTQQEMNEKLKEDLDCSMSLDVIKKLGVDNKILNSPKKSFRDYPNEKCLWDLLGKVYAIFKGRKKDN